MSEGANPSAARQATVSGLPYNSASGMNPLVWAANPLLDMVAQIRGMHQVDKPERVRNQLVLEIRNFEQRAQSVGVSRDELIGARYCLCTVLDEVAAQTPWGSKGVWGRQSMLVAFHNETWGGEKYYLLLARLAQNPEQHKNLIELLYYCNALGFEGRFRVESNGYTNLEMLKKRIATILGNVKGGYEARLSPHWQGVSSTPPVWRLIPPWVVAMLCGVAALGIYLWFLIALGHRSSDISAKLATIKIPETVVQRVVSLPPTNALARQCGLLEKEISKSLINVREGPNNCVVTLPGKGLFGSGSVDVRPEYLPVLERIAESLGKVNGEVIVHGYTDDVKISGLLLARYASNRELSLARAEVVKKMLDTYLGASGRIRAEGHGEADPIGDNRTADGRARNRRVAIEILLSAQDRQSNPSGGAQ